MLWQQPDFICFPANDEEVFRILGSIVLYICSYTAILALAAVLVLLVLRAVFTLIAPDADQPLINFVFNVTDFLMAPARYLLDKTGWFADFPLDMAHMITAVATTVILYLFLWVS